MEKFIHQYLSKPKYLPVEKADDTELEAVQISTNRSKSHKIWKVCLTVAIQLILSVLLAFVVWRTLRRCPYDDPERCRLYNHVFTQQEDKYALPSSPESDHTWRELFPPHGGEYIESPGQTKLFTYTVFHQLHCVASIRVAFYAALEARPLKEVGTNAEHIGHCIDFLRQSVMCYADTTIEGVNRTSGYGIPHKCRDWEEIKASTNKWIAARPD